MSSNHRKLTLLIARSLGVTSKSTPKLTRCRPGIDEVALPLDLAGAQVGHQALPLLEVDAEQLDLLPLPVAELAAGEVRVVEDRVEAVGVARRWGRRRRRRRRTTCGSGSSRGRTTAPAAAIWALMSCGRSAIGLSAVAAQRPVERVRDVEAVDVPVAAEPR